MGEVYKIIFQTTRALKPNSVTQSCPCGTPPSLAWLRYMDQAVTADPVGSVQVRRRIKMYKALLGPRAAIYGDHVELTRIIGAYPTRSRTSGAILLRRSEPAVCWARNSRGRSNGAKIQNGLPDAREGRALEEVDFAVQRENAFEGQFSGSLQLRV